ncbi:hypothetical protein AJ85_09925 [Alkalihalobacillus alcalophilus ATCC 27647 = CGMCC 1.3604]|uniref:Uncharacterized protein n=1 Tax=Alkalihalobacillus alcalophilus ATCC 27647 = CGMCC 1.3604 TaxID=1218173 RepID=A0A094WJY0_ALKAL|nr:hypothetical protein [Alkalihalobacillus alcalophilus]KGA97151.1 hypothetical protein BALCAV_0212070 [Alkalihalobacillus alcalophilus ATCC 27647 = CGMCC 1.3604]MED1563096.1 hypothetical protein [Alkalihalobacillus alcalophilus]THG90576.1 hypothetical protein AJ85_09925 [Alkalihalobacillus alcalophilus ATCC 27647 = CGMCC 1.3604]
MKKKLMVLVLAVAMVAGVFGTFTTPANAMMSERVLLSYTETWFTKTNTKTLSNQRYTTIQFRTNYSYTESKKNVSTVIETLSKIVRSEVTRTYRTW